MGDPKRQRKRYSGPKHPWKADRIVEETDLCKRYGLKNKKEIWKAKSIIGRFARQARTLLGSPGRESEKEAQEMIEKLNRLGIMETKSLEDVLGLTVEDLLKRRLQTVVSSKGFTNSPNQARQLIVHKHVLVGNRIIDVPGYLVPKEEEDKIKLKEGIKVTKSTKKVEEKLEEKKPGEKKEEKPKEKPGETGEAKPKKTEEKQPEKPEKSGERKEE